MAKPNPRTFRGVARSIRFSPDQKKLHKWISDLYRAKGPGTPFEVKQMIADCGLDYNSRRDYGETMGFLMMMRGAFGEVLEIFFGSQQFKNLKAKGATDEQIFQALVNSAVSWGIYPVWSDPNDRHYKLFECWDFIKMMKRRAQCSVNELNTKARIVGRTVEALPSLRPLERPKLGQDGVLYELPGGIRCDKCQQVFDTQEDFVKHYITHMKPEV